MSRWFVLLLLVHGSLQASVKGEGQRAVALLEAGDPSGASAIYAALLKEPLSALQKHYIAYNLATCQLAAQQYHEARGRLEELIGQLEGDPVLLRRAQTNLAHTCLEMSHGLSDPLGETGAQTRAHSLLALELLQQAAQACLAAAAQEKELSKKEQWPIDLLELRAGIKQAANGWLQRLAAANLAAGVTALLDQLYQEVAQSVRNVERAALEEIPIFAQLARLTHRLEPTWEASLVQLEAYEEPHCALQKGWQQFHCGQECLGDGNPYAALDHHVQAKIGVQASLHGVEPTLGSAISLLDDRCEVAYRWEQAPGEEEYRACLAQMERRHREAIPAVLRQEKGDDPLVNILLERLACRMERVPVSGREATRLSRNDRWLYRQVTESEQEDMERLCKELKRGVRPQQLDSHLLALCEKVSARLELCEDAELQEQLAAVYHPLDCAVELAATADTKELLQLVESALCAWNHSAWLRTYLEDWESRCEQVLSQGAVTPAFLEEFATEQAAVLAAASETGLEPGAHVRRAERDVRIACEGSGDTRATLCIQDAQRALSWAIEELSAKELPVAKTVLEQAIAEQQFACQLQRDVASIAGGESVDQELVQVAGDAQERVLERAAPFPGALCMMDEEVDSRVLKLFREGLHEAQGYARHLEMEPPEWEEANLRQELAIEKWEQALELIKGSDPPDEGSTSGDSGSESSNSRDTQEEIGAAPPLELFDVLQKMERDDRTDQQQAPALRRGIRPW